ncbi:hypothetical protein GOY14_00315 [Wolbachia endosymbiont of Dipetalonema caudispina]|uniref:hypothetical protein n=1 Tax=Wolbachia endosymbiont of Dipetalonema caudispina TaxID=1812112 RepID=UPI00158905B2|nr:hypothetical protein [Wolbachia endosymbiont of Dipetalonema caudispina]MCV3769452.1 hypothetical protein [Wolbachia pipientis]QKX00815.1 hypothetical protein GOY14_00315 [Wolbachia endosymbiont of Dipetalonema caudispina]
MSDDLWGFLVEVPSEGYMIESLYCTTSECSYYTGNIDPNNIWEFNLMSLDGKVVKKVGVDIVDFFEPRVRFNIDENGKKINLDIAPENCKVTEDGFLCINKNKQDYKLKFLIKKI